MKASTHQETPRNVAARIFGACGALLVASLLLLHPTSMLCAVQSLVTMMH